MKPLTPGPSPTRGEGSKPNRHSSVREAWRGEIEITDGHVDWMEHSLGLCRAVVNVSVRMIELGRMTAEDRKMLQRELKNRAAVMNKVKEGKRPGSMTGEERPWYDYMVAHAELEILWHSREIDATEFYARCEKLRIERDHALIKVWSQWAS